MRVMFEEDFPIQSGQFTPGEEVPAELADLPVERLRLQQGRIIDAAMLAAFYIDKQGRKHSERGAHRWQLLRCAFDDVIVIGSDGKWRVETDEERDRRVATVAWAPVRAERNRRLAESDWTQIPDAPLNSYQRRKWQDYRVALRNITRQPDPAQVEWPAKPE